ncbi:MAG: hypothetical protein WDM91_00110 [Rhizomicrobium sp.]
MEKEEILLTRDWGRISSKLLRVLWEHAETLCGALMEMGEDGFDAVWPLFLDETLRDLEHRRNRAGDWAQTWELAISLMAESDLLKDALRDGKAMFARGNPKSAFRTIASRALRKMRWPLLNARSPGHLAVWERLDKVSRDLLKEAGLGISRPYNRCQAEHFEALLARLRERHPNDHNLPRTLVSVEDLFQQFCSDCQQMMVEVEDAEEVSVQDVAVLPGFDRRLAFLDECSRQLGGVENEIIQTVLLRSKVVDISPDGDGRVERFCRDHGLARRQYYKHLNSAQLKIKLCIERKQENAI